MTVICELSHSETQRLHLIYIIIIHREDISFHFSLGFTALMRRFTGNKSLNTNQMFYTNLFNMNTQKDKSSKELQASRDYNSDANLVASASSNLNPFSSSQSDQTNNLLILLQGFQMVASRSNVVLFAVGGIVSGNSANIHVLLFIRMTRVFNKF